MRQRNQIDVVTREKPSGHGERQSFQASVVPTAVLSGEDLYEQFAKFTGDNIGCAEAAIRQLERFVLAQLAKGVRLNFGIVSFAPRLSGALSARDADPESEGVFVRGAVKARRSLTGSLKEHLEPVNELSVARPRLFGVCEVETGESGVVRPGRMLAVSGRDIPIDAGRADEGVWLETRARGKVAAATVLESTAASAKIVFSEVPEGGKKYKLVVYTRGGRGSGFTVRRCLADVRVP